MIADHATRPDWDSRETLWCELRGGVERITFQHRETGFTVARLAPERRDAEAASTAVDERLVVHFATLPNLHDSRYLARIDAFVKHHHIATRLVKTSK